MRKLMILIIAFYQRALSPLFPSSCRFVPSCSEYAREALDLHGWRKGFFLILKRIIRCQPLCRGGVDPVPQARIFKD